MDYGGYYTLNKLAVVTESYLDLIIKGDLDFFLRDNLPFDMREIKCTIAIAKHLRLGTQVFCTSHPAIHSAVEGLSFYEEKFKEKENPDIKKLCQIIYKDIIIFLVDSMISSILDIHIKLIEKEINELDEDKSIVRLTKECQDHTLENRFPQKFVKRYKEHLEKRIRDFRELIELNRLTFGTELKEILISYKLALEININGRNLLTPLLNKEYSVFIENLKTTLLTPSYYDIGKKEPERYYHVYLLGILEGRLNFYKINSNRESGFGRYDICAIPLNKSNPGMIIEIKANTSLSSNEDALTQIKKNEYTTELKNEGVKDVLLLSINFREKDIEFSHEEIHL